MCGCRVLIETLWNVNSLVMFLCPFSTCCINRNIVECKCIISPEYEGLQDGINRNIVECKSGYVRRETKRSMVLIETLWNVNLPEQLKSVVRK